MPTYKHKLTERVVHTSLSTIQPIDSSSVVQFPSVPCRIGVLARAGLDRQCQPPTYRADVSCEVPRIDTTCTGELVELADLDGYIRTKLLTTADVCRLLAAELVKHASRLEQVAAQHSVTDDLSRFADGVIRPDDDGLSVCLLPEVLPVARKATDENGADEDGELADLDDGELTDPDEPALTTADLDDDLFA